MNINQPQEYDFEDVREGTFEWKIGDVTEEAKEIYKESSKFNLRTHLCSLCLYYQGYGYYMIAMKIAGSGVQHNTFYKMCLIDIHGKERLVMKRTEFLSGTYFNPLMVIGSCELMSKKKELLPNGVLALCLSWGDEDSSTFLPHTAPDTNSEKGPIKLFDTLSDDFSRFYESKKNTDCVLKVSGTEFPVHRAVLSARSEVFAAMFQHDTSENLCGEVDIPDVDKTVISDILQYLYSGQIHGLSAETAAPMYVAADKYVLIELRSVCLGFLKRSLTIDNVCDAALLAHMHGETDLEEKIVQFIKIKLEEIEETNQWKELLRTKPLLAVKLLRSALLADKK